MNDAVLYVKSNSFQRDATKAVFYEFAHLLQWQKDGRDSVLDVGCGTGDVTIEIVLPLIPPTFSRLLGCDISDKMIDYAQQHYGRPKVNFSQLDINEDVDEFRNKFGLFDHVVSFFCLHWVRNQKSAMENIRKLLTPNGDCLLLFITSSNIYTVWAEMAKSSKWSPYMQDVEQFTSPYYDSMSTIDDLRELFQAVGFSYCAIRSRQLKHMYNNYEEFISKVSLQ